MAVRLKKYFKQCKGVSCNGKRSRQCPETPKRQSGQYKSCSAWAIEFFDDNKQWQSLTFKDVRNRTDAEKRLSMFISDRERGKLNLPSKKHIPTLGEYLNSYIQLYKAGKENTLLAKKRNVNILTKHLGQYRLDQVTPFIIEKYRIERKENDKVREITINCEVVTLTHVFNTAIKNKVVDNNPCREVKRFKETTNRDRILSNKEIALLMENLQGKDRLMILIGLFSGMRLNEVVALQWENIDLTKHLLTFTQSKTNKSVVIPLSSILINELTAYRDNTQGDRLFESRDISTRVVSEYSLHFSKLFKRFGINGFTFHNLRHTFASLQAELGTGAIVTRDLLGHSTLNMTLRYSHTNLDSRRKAIEEITKHVIDTTQEKTVQFLAQA